MSTSSRPPDRFQREIDDIIRLAERRLERQSPGYRVKQQVSRFRRGFGGMPSISLPDPEVLAGLGLAALLLTFLLGLPRMLGIAIPGLGLITVLLQAAGFGLLAVAIILSVLRGRRGGGAKTWRGERISYGSPYGGAGLGDRIRRFFRGR